MKTITVFLLSLFTAPSLAQVCDPPLEVETCEIMAAMGTINVRCAMQSTAPHAFTYPVDPLAVWASPNDECDDTAGLNAAMARAHVTSEVFLPAGVADGSGAPYATFPYLVSGSVDISNRRVRGIRSSSQHHGTRVAVFPGIELEAAAECASVPLVALPATMMVACGEGSIFRSTHQTILIGVSIDANHADFGVTMFKNHSGQLRETMVTGAGMAGVLLEQSVGMTVENVTAYDNKMDGLRIVGCNSSIGQMLRSTSNVRHGLVVAGWRPEDPIGHTGEFSVWGGDLEANGGHGFYVSSAVGVTLAGLRMEGNHQDAARIENSRNVTIRDVRTIQGPTVVHPDFESESLWHSISVEDSHGVLIDSVVVGGTNPKSTDMWIEGSSRYVDVRSTYWMGSSIGVFDTFNIRAVEAESVAQYKPTHRREWAAHAAPTGGYWRTADIVWNASPWNNEVVGWVCRNTSAYGGDCYAWLPFGPLP